MVWGRNNLKWQEFSSTETEDFEENQIIPLPSSSTDFPKQYLEMGLASHREILLLS